jgi:hypothetical protein
MSGTIIVKYVNPWKFRRDEEQKRLRALRQRDGDDCRRCRRPMRFDLPRGHDMGAAIEEILPRSAGGSEGFENQCLCHRRCNSESADNTREVQDRIRQKNEAELFAKSRSSAGLGG